LAVWLGFGAAAAKTPAGQRAVEAVEQAAPTVDSVAPSLESQAEPLVESTEQLTEKASEGVLLPTFSRSTIDSAVADVARPASSQISVGARALAKKLGHAEGGNFTSAFAGLKATTETAQSVVREILTNPARTVFGKATYDVYDAAGRGARFGLEGGFKGFLEAGQATR
jgi:hypothetical protein